MEHELRRLLIVSHVAHYRYNDRLYAYGPYAREIEVWSELFSEVIIAAPCRNEAPPGSCLPFTRSNISIQPQKETGGETRGAKIKQIFALPGLVWTLSKAMRRADAIHVRCPGNLGLLGIILAPFFSRCLVAKYAGQWSSYPGEPWSVRLQKAILRSKWWRGPVTVYGHWPNQPSNVIPFFTSILSAEQVIRARAAVSIKRVGNPLRVLYVGRLSAAKNVDVLLSAVAELRKQNLDLELLIVGDGLERPALEAQVRQLGISDRVEFSGGVDFDRVHDFYEQSDVLVLASETEGWPKAITEAMAFGLICIGSDRGLVPWILGDGRGIVLRPRDRAALRTVLQQVAKSPENYDLLRSEAAAWAQKYSLESLRDSLRDLLTENWGVTPAELKPGLEARERVLGL